MVKRLKLMAPVIFRLILLCCLCLGIAGLADPIWGFGLLILGLFLEIFMHLNYIVLLAQWLEEPGLPDTPSVRSGIWSEIFYRISKSRRQLEKNTRRLTEREARYRKTLAALPEGIVLVKSDWSVTWCNDVAEKSSAYRVKTTSVATFLPSFPTKGYRTTSSPATLPLLTSCEPKHQIRPTKSASLMSIAKRAS